MEQTPQSQLKLLVAKGKEQGYLTYAEVNDHLPQDIVDSDQIEDIIQMINDMGIQVVESAPDADDLILTEPAADEDAAEAAAQAYGKKKPRFRMQQQTPAEQPVENAKDQASQQVDRRRSPWKGTHGVDLDKTGQQEAQHAARKASQPDHQQHFHHSGFSPVERE